MRAYRAQSRLVMKLFAKKAKEPAAPPPAALPVPPPVLAPAELEDPALKLNLPNVFEFDASETKVKTAGKRRRAEEADDTLVRGTILLVESDEEILRLMSRFLSHEGYTLLKATCLAEARTLLASERADYVLARRQCVPLNTQTEHILRDLHAKTQVRIVDDFSELLLGQVIDYESIAQSALDLTGLLMSLLEGGNIGARGHAHNVAKYCRLVGQRLGLSRRDLDAVTLAGLLHDLGSLETLRQIGAPLYRRDDATATGNRVTAEMLANIAFPYEIADLHRLATQEDAAAPARLVKLAQILRVADAYDSLRRSRPTTQSADDELFEELRRQPAGTFDSQVLETFINLRKNEQVISAMNIFWAGILVVDPNPEEQQLLRLRLENDDLHVLAARSVEEALAVLRKENITLVLCEHQLEGRGDGFELLRTMRADPQLRQVAFVFHAHAETDRVKYALELGAEDWLAKPHNVEITAMKLQRIIARRSYTGDAGGEGVHGQLREMGLIEMVHILCAGNRSVQIVLENRKRTGEMTLQHGHIIAATVGELTGEAAVFELLAWNEGVFRILPLRQVPPVTIRTGTDNLLIQWCHLQDTRTDPALRGL
jgi:response regulator RpfG family c-di-GMP phosphodiesterase